MNDFLWHEISDKERKEIQKKAKGIMEDFARKLESYEKKLGKEASVEREKCEREESEDVSCANGFNKKIMFDNAPKKEGDFIVAEEGGW